MSVKEIYSRVMTARRKIATVDGNFGTKQSRVCSSEIARLSRTPPAVLQYLFGFINLNECARIMSIEPFLTREGAFV